VGTGTDVGKTWVGARLLAGLRAAGVTASARKPAQSFDPADDPGSYDAAVLGAATGEAPELVCPPHRWYEVALAPPMAAEALGRPSFSVAELSAELGWPATAPPPDVGLVETAGGLRSPLAADGDCLAFCASLDADLVVLVADAGLGTINAVRLTVDALKSLAVPIVVVLNRFDVTQALHVRNAAWLRTQDGLRVFTVPGDEQELVDLARPMKHLG
jgi:dethiobiotin synthetase